MGEREERAVEWRGGDMRGKRERVNKHVVLEEMFRY